MLNAHGMNTEKIHSKKEKEKLYTKARLFQQLIVSQGSLAAMQLTPKDWDDEDLYDSK